MCLPWIRGQRAGDALCCSLLINPGSHGAGMLQAFVLWTSMASNISEGMNVHRVRTACEMGEPREALTVSGGKNISHTSRRSGSQPECAGATMSSGRRIAVGSVCITVSIALLSCASSGGSAGVGIEKSKYSVLEKEGRFELRFYEPCIVAETVVESDFDDAGNIAFRRLYNYISGENRKKESIAMTAPVNQEGRSEKIAMTAPVGQLRSGDEWVVSFLMPSQYTMQTLPEPLDPAVKLREIPARKMASLRYSGTWSQRRYEERLARLRLFVEQRKWKVTGEPVFARYDPPFQLPFFRRNEVLIPVE
jgi:hypothetical protein